MESQWKVDELVQILKKKEDHVSNYYKKKKGLIEPQKGTRKRLGRQNPLDKNKEKEEKRTNLLNHNELFYFGPARTAISLTRDALKKWEQGALEAAIEKQQEAMEHFDHDDFEFNLGKMYVESGLNYQEGLFHLINYFERKDEADHYKTVLMDYLNIEMEEDAYYGYLSDGDVEVNFEVSDHEISFGDESVFQTSVPLAFKIPVNLNLERKDTEKIQYRDYWYITELQDSTDADVCSYEIKIHQNKSKEFIEVFYSTVIELSQEGKMDELSSFDTLKHKLFLYNLQKQYYHQGMHDEPFEIAFPEDTSLISILLIELPLENNQEFLDLFMRFASEHLFTVNNYDEISEEEIDEAEYTALGDWEAQQDKKHEYLSFLKQSELFATLTVLLDNLKNNIPDPYQAENESLFLSAKEQYLAHLGDLFDEIKDEHPDNGKKVYPKREENTKQNDKLLQEIDHILEQIRSDKVRQSLRMLLYDARNSLESTPRQSVGTMRLTLEVLIKESCLTVGYSLTEGNKKKNLYQLILDTKERVSKNIDQLIYKIRTNGNNALHYDEIRGLITFSEKEAKDHLNWLLQVIDFYVKKFKV
ncbi:hypothetical protein [Neobacillus niacini]|uniref:hypothetical protein n=1 Tax=Neobacillus niacini TaxID=86668 RepID=UPI00203D94F8|nr:hypothetical protein [Neobacillus niacini]MCM3693248.1 hypothetical protein [Neobacillus niacini]